MFHRFYMQADGTHHAQPAGEDVIAALSQTHLQWLERLLSESPATIAPIVLADSPEGALCMEWQSALLGAGLAFLTVNKRAMAACLVLDGRFAAAERAAIDALEQTLLSRREFKSRVGFDLLRRSRGRRLRALVVLESMREDSQMLRTIEYWSDCLGVAFFKSISVVRAATANDAAASQPVRAI